MLRPGVRSRGSRHRLHHSRTTLHNGLIVDRPVFEPFELGLLRGCFRAMPGSAHIDCCAGRGGLIFLGSAFRWNRARVRLDGDAGRAHLIAI